MAPPTGRCRTIATPPLSSRDRAFTLAGVLLALFLGALDQTIVSTALPRIVEDLGGVERYAWVATSYLLVSTALVPIYGRLADLMSRRRIEIWAIGLFLAGSVLCGIAGKFGPLPIFGDGMMQLVLFRGLQGIGGAGLFAMAFIVIADLFPPAERGRYQGFVGAVFGVSSILGPVLGGVLADRAGGILPGVEGWRWIFLVNLPFGAVALTFILKRMPPLIPAGAAGGGTLDRGAAALLVAGLIPLVLALQFDRRRYPWLPGMEPIGGGAAVPAEAWATLLLLAAGGVALALFVRRTLRSTNPLLDLDLFRNPVFRWSNAAAFLFGAAFLSILFFLPLFMVNVAGVSATAAGVAVMPLSLSLVAGSTIGGQFVSRRGHYRRVLLVGGGALLCGTLLLASLDPTVPPARITLYMILCGLGIGPTFPLFTLAVQNAVDVRRVGQATGAIQFFRQIGGTVGTAVMGTVLAVGLAQGTMGVPDLPLEGGAVSAGVADVASRALFSDAITRIWAWTSVVVLLAILFTSRVPELPLRRTFAPAPPEP